MQLNPQSTATKAEKLGGDAARILDLIHDAPSVANDGQAPLLQQIVQHRVVGRILAESGPEHQAAALVPDLRSHFLSILADYRERSLAAEAVFRAIGEITPEVIVLKGDSAFGLTKDPFHIRPTYDCDVLVREPSECVPLLEQFDRTDITPAIHEELHVRNRGKTFDFHKYFPVWVHAGSAVPVASCVVPRKIEHSRNVQVRHLEFERVLRVSELVQQVGKARVLEAEPAAAAFILITHLYRDLIRTYGLATRNRPRIKLNELLELRDTVRSGRFAPKVLRLLIDEFGAFEQARLIGSLIWACFGDDQLLTAIGGEALFHSTEEPIPLSLDAWHGFSFQVDITIRRLLAARYILPDLLGEMPGTLLRLEGGAGAVHLDSHDGTTFCHTSRASHRCTGRLAVRGRSLEISATFAGQVDPEAPLTIFLGWGDTFLQLDFEQWRASRAHLAVGQMVVTHADHRHSASGESLELSLQLEPPIGAEFRAVVFVGRLQKSIFHLRAGVMFPLVVTQ